MALRLNEEAPLRRAYLAIPVTAIELVAQDLPIPYLDSFLRYVATQMAEQPHLEFHLKWVQALLSGSKGPYLRQTRNTMAPQLRALHKALVERRDGLAKLYAWPFLMSSKAKRCFVSPVIQLRQQPVFAQVSTTSVNDGASAGSCGRCW